MAIGACITSAVVHAVLTPAHLEEHPVVGVLFGLATAALLIVAAALTRPSIRIAPAVAAALFASLLASYPIALVAEGDGVESLAVLTKLVEAVGLVAALRSRGSEESFVSIDVLVGVFVALMFLSVGSHHH